MEIQISLLQNSVEHLNKSLFIISQELTLLKEFVREEFASEFQDFCKNKDKAKSPDAGTGTGSNALSGPGPSASKKRKTTIGPEGPVPGVTISSFADLEELISHKRSVNTNNDGVMIKEEHPESSVADNDEEMIVADLTQNDTSEEENDDDNDVDFEILPDQEKGDSNEKPKGKPKSLIHKYFEEACSETKRGKKRCLICSSLCSNQAQRMRKHFINCVKTSGLQVDQDVLHTIISVGMQHNRSKQSEAATRLKRAELWSNFEIVVEEGSEKVKCLKCGCLTKKQAQKMRRHLHKCSNHPPPETTGNNVISNAEEEESLSSTSSQKGGGDVASATL